MNCIICGKEIKSGCALSKHINSKHNITTKEYYDHYYKKLNEGICPTCGKSTPFLKFSKGYQKHCSAKCAQNDKNVNNTFRNNNPQKNPEIRSKTKQTCIEKFGVEYPFQSDEVKTKIKQTNLQKIGCENPYQQPNIQAKARINSHNSESNIKRENTKKETIQQIANSLNAIYIQDLLNITKSSGWYQSNIVDIIKYKNHLFIKNEDIQKVLDYDNNAYNTYSLKEKYIVNCIKNVYSGIIIENSRKIISPKELDIYLPELKLAIEFNGIYFHSSIANCPIDYHLTKSLLCRQQNIRLIHIYEFENLDDQINKLISLINGVDNFNNEDFNKNNLIEQIPMPEIIYNDNRLVIYGAGLLK